MSEIPERLWLPLYMLDISGPIVTKTKFQKLAFLVQYFSKIDIYDFRKHYYGPYSDDFALDTVTYPTLIEHTINDSMYSDRQYHTYEITTQGKEQLAIFKKKISPDVLEHVKENFTRYAEKNHCELLEESYSRFALKPQDSLAFKKEVIDNFMQIKPNLTRCYETYQNRQSTFLLSTLEVVEYILKAIDTTSDTVKKGIVLNLSKEIIQKCNELINDIAPPAKSELLRPRFIEISELESFLREYCHTRNIVEDQLEAPLEDIIAEDEAQRLSQTLRQVHAPA